MKLTLWQKSLVFSLVLNIAAIGLAGLEFKVLEREQQTVAEVTFDLSAPLDEGKQEINGNLRQLDSRANRGINHGRTALDSNTYSTDPMLQEQGGLAVSAANGNNNYAAAHTGGAAVNAAMASKASTASQPGTQGISPPRIMNRIRPHYPENARRQGVSGTVKVRALVSTDGTVSECLVLVSSGSQELDEAAAEAVRQWHFAPASDKATGQPISAYILLPVVFRID